MVHQMPNHMLKCWVGCQRRIGLPQQRWQSSGEISLHTWNRGQLCANYLLLGAWRKFQVSALRQWAYVNSVGWFLTSPSGERILVNVLLSWWKKKDKLRWDFSRSYLIYNFQHRPVWDDPCVFSGWTFDINKILCKFGDWRRGFSWHRCTCCQQLSRQKLFVFGLCLQSAFILILWLPLVSAQHSHASGRCGGNPLGAPWAVKLRAQADGGLRVSFVGGIRSRELGTKGK